MSIDDIKDTIHRFSDVAGEPCIELTPIAGFNKFHLVPLEQAIVPLLPIVPRIEVYAHVAKQRATNPADDLSIDESASIALYTMEWEPFTESVYYILNNTLRSEDRQQLKPWFSYLKLVLTALSRLPSLNTTVYRGVKHEVDFQGEKYRVGKEIFWWGFSSCSKSRDISEREQFVGESGGARTVFIIDCLMGKDVRRHSYYRNEQEVLLLPATKVRVVNNETRPGELHVITLQEIVSSHIFLEPVSTPMEIKQLKEQSTLRAKFSVRFFKTALPDADRYFNRRLNECIAAYKQHSDVYLNGQRFNDNDLRIIVDQLITGKQCHELTLRETNLTCHGVMILAKALHDNQHLERLTLSHNLIGDQGVQALAQALQGNNNVVLKQLSLGYNVITDVGVQHLVEMLASNRTLTHLYLHKNHISDEGLQALIQVLIHSNRTLQVLSLEWNRFRDRSSGELLASLLSQNRTLTSLNVNSCKLSRTAVKQLKTLAKGKNNFELRID